MHCKQKNKALKACNKQHRRRRLEAEGDKSNDARNSDAVDGVGARTRAWAAGSQCHQDEMRRVHNALFERYYGELQQLGRLVCDDDASDDAASVQRAWQREMALLRTPLPTTFWIDDTDPLAAQVRAHMCSLDAAIAQPIAWYPLPGMAWRITADKTSFRKRPELAALRRYLIEQTALGTLSRQEEVSMIPPFLLQLQPHDVCLDMCASPGSKTAQLLVALGRHKRVVHSTDAAAGDDGSGDHPHHPHGDVAAAAPSSSSPFPFDYASEGLVVANELDTRRANMLVHQVKRLRLLFPFALFTNHDARYFPDLELRSSSTDDEHNTDTNNNADDTSNKNSNSSNGAATSEVLRFDKVLCDVVCSGDGTLRKAPHLLRAWSPREAMLLQKTQIHIALRGCHLLKVGGRLVYSTCSLNPVENEAVVAQVVHRTRGAMRLVDAHALLPSLPCAPGLTSWHVMDVHGDVVTRPGERQMHEALFPPRTPHGYTSPAVDALDLRRCLRLLPSHCGGGGFFIAVLEKVAEWRTGVTSSNSSGSSSRQDKKDDNDEDDSELVPPAAAAPAAGAAAAPTAVLRQLAPPQYAAAPPAIATVLRDFYHIAGFPCELLRIRTAHGERALRLSSSSVCTLVARTAARVLARKTDALLVVSAGLRVLAHESLDKGWRIASEAAPLFGQLMRHSPRCVRVPVALVDAMMTRGGKLKEVSYDALDDVALREQLLGLSLGTVLLVIDAPAAVGGVFYSVALRARSRLQLLVDHEDLVGMRLRLGLHTTTMMATTEEQQQQEEEQPLRGGNHDDACVCDGEDAVDDGDDDADAATDVCE